MLGGIFSTKVVRYAARVLALEQMREERPASPRSHCCLLVNDLFRRQEGRVRGREFLTKSTLLSTLFTFAAFALIRDYLLCLVSCQRRKGRLFVQAEVLFEMVSRNAYIYIYISRSPNSIPSDAILDYVVPFLHCH